MNPRLVAVTLAVSLTAGRESLDKQKMGTLTGAVLGAASKATVSGTVALVSCQRWERTSHKYKMTA